VVDLAQLVLLMRRLLALALGLGLAACTNLAFYPTRQLVLTPDQIGLAYREVDFEAADGVRLHGWFLPARPPRVGSVLFVHGNAENISTHIGAVAWLPAAGFDVLLFDYRGYGRSEGVPSLAGLHLDFEAALDLLLDAPESAADKVVVLGQSLGGALAITALADSPKRDRVRALVVEGAFTSYRGLAREKLAGFWLTWALQWPLGFTIDDRYRPIEAIAELAPMPVLVIQGEADQIVPPHHGVELFEAAGAPKALWLVEGTGHIQAFTRPEVRAYLLDYLRSVLDVPRAAPRAAVPRPRRTMRAARSRSGCRPGRVHRLRRSAPRHPCARPGLRAPDGPAPPSGRGPRRAGVL
jgi:fermentation-respiration switch protein FrsA (DUF1100 family)